VSSNGKDRLGLVPAGSYKILIQGAQNRMMNPTHDAFDVDGKKGDTSDSPEEISFIHSFHLPSVKSLQIWR